MYIEKFIICYECLHQEDMDGTSKWIITEKIKA